MKRILTVLTRREIHQQVIRAKEMLVQQTRREVRSSVGPPNHPKTCKIL